ncbi:MAG: hypothetical protein RIQ79_1196 [Verrucomicrobiota bacterium]
MLHLGLIAATVAGLGLAGCASPVKKVAVQETKVRAAYASELTRLQSLETRTLAWPEARELLLKNNLDLRQSRDDIIRAHEDRQRVFLDLLPIVSLSGGLSRALTDLGHVNPDDLRFSVFSFVSVPGLVNLRTRHYTAALGQLRADWALALKERELTAELYRTFVRFQGLKQRQQNLARTQLWAIADPRRPLDADPEVIERETQLFSIHQELDTVQAHLAGLLGSYDYRWDLVPTGLPSLDYLQNPIDLADLDNTGVLFRQLQAAELEAARLRELGVKLQRWPDLGFSLSSPPLYERSGGTSRDWDINQVNLNATASLQLDTQWRTAFQLRDTRRQLKLMQAQLALERTLSAQRLDTARRALALADTQLKLVTVRLEALSGSPLSLNVAELRQQLQKTILLSEQRDNLLQQKAGLETFFWITDERAWTRPAATP